MILPSFLGRASERGGHRGRRKRSVVSGGLPARFEGDERRLRAVDERPEVGLQDARVTDGFPESAVQGSEDRKEPRRVGGVSGADE